MEQTSVDVLMASCPAMIFVASPRGELRSFSAAMRARVGHLLEAEASLSALAGPDDGDALAAFLDALAAQPDAAKPAPACVLHTSAADGEPLALRCVGQLGADGAIHGSLELDLSPQPVEIQIERTLLHALVSTLDIVVWAIDTEGTFVYQDGKALATAGMSPGQLVGANLFDLYPPKDHPPVREVLAGTPSSRESNEVHGRRWESWMVPLWFGDEVKYAAGLSLDVTEQVEVARNLERQLQTIQSQQAAIYELSAPILNIWDHVLAVPLIGIMDSERSEELGDRLLAAAHRSETRFALIDLTGVDAVDTSIAAHVLGLLKSLSLLGVEGIVTGVSPDVARTMVGVGIDIEAVQTHRTLREGLRYCMRELLASGP